MVPIKEPARPTCFHETNPTSSLTRRSAVECTGTLLLMLAATSAGLVARRLGIRDPGVALLCSAMATSGALVGLVVAFGNASGGHFNPLITALQWFAGERGARCTLAYIAAQFTGGLLGALVANQALGAALVLAAPAVASTTMVLSEVIATAGLMIVIFGCSRSALGQTGPFAVGAWLMAAIVAMPSGSYANPVITVAATLVGGGIALSPHVALLYVPAEIAGALIALGVISIAYPPPRPAGPLDMGRMPPDGADALISRAGEQGGEKTLAPLVTVRVRQAMGMLARMEHVPALEQSRLSQRRVKPSIFDSAGERISSLQAEPQVDSGRQQDHLA